MSPAEPRDRRNFGSAADLVDWNDDGPNVKIPFWFEIISLLPREAAGDDDLWRIRVTKIRSSAFFYMRIWAAWVRLSPTPLAA